MSAEGGDARSTGAVDYADYLARARSALSELEGGQRDDAARVLELVVVHARGEPLDQSLVRRELLGLIERLGRRGSAAIPLASLARALSADLRGDFAVRDESLRSCDRALLVLGL